MIRAGLPLAALPLAVLLVLAGCDRAAAPAAANNEAAAPGGASTEAPTEAMQAYRQAADRMHQDMGGPDRDPDIAFAQGMIPHHEGAIAMARVELRYGRDPEMRRLAQEVIAAQDAEIALMRRWLAAKGRTATDAGPPPMANGTSHAH